VAKPYQAGALSSTNVQKTEESAQDPCMPHGPPTRPWIQCGVIPLAPWISLLSLSRSQQNPLLRSRLCLCSLLTAPKTFTKSPEKKFHFITKKLKKKNQVKPVTEKWQWLALFPLSGAQRFLPFYSPPPPHSSVSELIMFSEVLG